MKVQATIIFPVSAENRKQFEVKTEVSFFHKDDLSLFEKNNFESSV